MRRIVLSRYAVFMFAWWKNEVRFVWSFFFSGPVPRNWCLIVRALRRVERRAINNLSRRFLHVGSIARSKGYATLDGHVSASGTGFHEDGRDVRIEVRGPIKACSRSKGKGNTRGRLEREKIWRKTEDLLECDLRISELIISSLKSIISFFSVLYNNIYTWNVSLVL